MLDQSEDAKLTKKSIWLTNWLSFYDCPIATSPRVVNGQLTKKMNGSVNIRSVKSAEKSELWNIISLFILFN